jgi:arylsulfatase A-like enzyme
VRPAEPSALARARLTLDRWLGRSPPRIELPLAVVMGHEPELADAAEAEPQVAKAPPRPNILIYLVDTLRADHLGAYGYELDTSPRIDALAADGVLFENARAQTSWTRTAVVSLFTGLLPQVHGVNRRADALAPSVKTLADRLSEHGYRTAGILTNGNVSENFGLQQGFDEYIQLWERNDHWSFHQLSDRVNQRVFRWFDARQENIRRDPTNDHPFLLYVHTTDPHGPYTPPEPFYSRFAAGVDKVVGQIRNVHDISAGRKVAPPGTAEDWIRLYDGEIAFNDHNFGLLLDDLKARGLYDSTLIVLTSDHGEEFFEHGGWEHGKTLYDEQLLIPLIVKPPADWGIAPGQRITAPAHQVDILPTLLDALGIDPGDELDGRSLLPLLKDAPEESSPASLAYLELGEHHKESVVEHGFKLIRDLHRVRSGDRGMLFDLGQDPGEQVDRNHAESFRWGQLRQVLEALHFDLRRRSRGIDPEEAEIDEALRERLEALGYTD